MSKYQFEAEDSSLNQIVDIIEATSEADAQRQIRERGLFLKKIDVVETKPETKPDPKPIDCPGIGACYSFYFITLLKESVLGALIAFVVGIGMWGVARLCNYNPDFWFVERCAVGGVLVLIFAIETYRLAFKFPLMCWSVSKVYNVTFGEARIAIKSGYFGEVPEDQRDTASIRSFVLRHQFAESIVKSAMY